MRLRPVQLHRQTGETTSRLHDCVGAVRGTRPESRGSWSGGVSIGLQDSRRLAAGVTSLACASRPLTSSRRPGSTVFEEGRFDVLHTLCWPRPLWLAHTYVPAPNSLLYVVASANGSVSIAVLVAEAGPCDAVQPAVNRVAGQRGSRRETWTWPGAVAEADPWQSFLEQSSVEE